MTKQTSSSTTEAPAADASLPEQLSDALAMVSGARAEGLSQAEVLRVVELAESMKGAAAALQARATVVCVESRDEQVARARADGVISAREARCRRRATRAEVALARRCSPGQVDRHVGLAKALVHDLPHTLEALTSGELSEWRATIVTRETACLSHEDRLEVDRRLAGCLITLSDKELAAASHRATVDLDAAALVRRRERAVASRGVSVRPAPDGMAWLSILGPLHDVVGAFAALKKAEAARHALTGDPMVDAARIEDDRGRGAWLADTALELLSGRGEGQPQPVEVGLVMREEAVVPSRIDDIAGSVEADVAGSVAGDEVEVPGFGAMPGQMAREHLLRLCDSGTATWLRRLWTRPSGADLVAMDSRRRLFSGVLRQLVELRDTTCRVPWCGAPVRDVDHVTPHARGGETSATNAAGLCQAHNLSKEAPGWRAEVTASGLDPGVGPHEFTLTTPTGSEYACLAPPLLGHGRPPRPVRADRRSEPGVEPWTRPDLVRSPMEVYLSGVAPAA